MSDTDMKKMTKWIVLALCVAILGTFLLAQWRNTRDIHWDEVVKVHFAGVTESEAWSTEDAQTFIDLFNMADYAGRGTGEGGTPEVQIYVWYQDGSYLIVSEFNCLGRDFEVSLKNADNKKIAWYYVNSEELEAFVYEMVKKYADQ